MKWHDYKFITSVNSLPFTPIFCRVFFYTIFFFFPLFFPPFSYANLTIKEGLEYRKITTNQSQIVHVLEIDPNKFSIELKHAKGQAVGLDTLSTLAKENNAIAAINGGFFHMGEGKDGLPAGILKIDGQWYGIAYSNRAALGWYKNKSSMLIHRLQTKTTLKIKHHSFPLHVLNQPGAPNRAVLYTPAFGQYADPAQNGKDIIIENNRITAIVPSGKTEIPKNGYVYSIGEKIRHLYHPKVKDPVTLNIQIIPETKNKQLIKHWQTFDNIVGGTPLLIDNGSIVIDPFKRMQSPFVVNQRARTAFGLSKTGSWVFVVVEKNKINESMGMTLFELAEFMKEQRIVQAINLDGGSSSGMYLEDKLISVPEDPKEESALNMPLIRPIGDAILVVEK